MSSNKHSKPVVERIRPVIVRTPQCEANLVSEEAIRFRRHQGKKGTRCTNMATYKINGKLLCGRHAGAMALAILGSRK